MDVVGVLSLLTAASQDESKSKRMRPAADSAKHTEIHSEAPRGYWLSWEYTQVYIEMAAKIFK